MIPCPKCSSRFTNPNGLRDHLASEHQSPSAR